MYLCMQKKSVIMASVFVVSLLAGFGIAKELLPDPPVPEPEPIFVTRFLTYNDTVVRGEDSIEITTVMRYEDKIVNGKDTIQGDGKLVEKKERIIAKMEPGQGSMPVPMPEPDPKPKPDAKIVPTPNPKLDSNIVPEPDPQKPVKPLMTKAEFQGLLLNSSDNTLEGDGSKKVSGSVRISVINIQLGENSPYNPAGVREKIETKTWKSARVISIESDPKTGKIIGATVEPIY